MCAHLYLFPFCQFDIYDTEALGDERGDTRWKVPGVWMTMQKGVACRLESPPRYMSKK